MRKGRALKKNTTISAEEWRKRSQCGERCGVLGCTKEPICTCLHCGNSYCKEHLWTCGTPAHMSGIIEMCKFYDPLVPGRCRMGMRGRLKCHSYRDDCPCYEV